MVLGALDGVEEAVPVVGDALQHVVDPAGSDGGKGGGVAVSIAFKQKEEIRSER